MLIIFEDNIIVSLSDISSKHKLSKNIGNWTTVFINDLYLTYEIHYFQVYMAFLPYLTKDI